jgi:hypothetical protein
VLIVFQIIALVIAAILAVGIGRAGWIKTFTPIVQLAGSGVVWAKDIPLWSVRIIGVLELLAAMAILTAPIWVFVQGPNRLVTIVGVAASLGVALLMASAFAFHRQRGEAQHTWKTNLAFGSLAVMAAATLFISSWG